jgi:hypothetical protein
MKVGLLDVLLGAIAGAPVTWWIRSLLENKKRRLKDCRHQITIASSLIDDIEELAIQYYLKPGRDSDAENVALKIKTRLKKLGSEVNAVNRAHSGSTALTFLKTFRQAVTLDDFDSADRQPIKASDPKFESISTAAVRLNQALEAVYNSLK